MGRASSCKLQVTSYKLPVTSYKLQVTVELIWQAVARGERVLATAASNVAVDNMAERLLAGGGKPRLVRIGHPARLLPSVLDSSLDACNL